MEKRRTSDVNMNFIKPLLNKMKLIVMFQDYLVPYISVLFFKILIDFKYCVSELYFCSFFSFCHTWKFALKEIT
jgi:hypothetical protein